MMGKATYRAGAWLTTQRLLVAVLFVAVFAMAAGTGQPADTDTWWHLKSGQLMWDTGRLLRTDPFSHTVAGQPILYPALAQVFFWPVYRVFGLGGLALLLAVIVATTFALVYRQCEGRPFVAAFATLLAVVTSSVIWSIRPQLISLLLAAITTYLLDRYRQTGNARRLWVLPLLVVLWVNCHGGFVIAFILMGCYLVGETLNRLTAPVPPAPASPSLRSSALNDGPPQRERGGRFRFRPFVVATLVSIPAVLLNPHGARMIPYAFQTVSIGPLQDFIQEWAAPNFHNLQFQPFIWLLLLTLAAVGLSRRRADWTDLALVGVFGYMGLLAVRNIALFALVTPPVLTRHLVAYLDDLALIPRFSWVGALTHTLPPPRPRRPLALLNAALLVLVLLAAGVKVGLDLARLRDAQRAVWGRGLPLGAVDYLRTHELPGQMFNTYNWGGYLIWSLYPDKPVFVDGRTDLYALNSHVLEDYVQVHWVRPGWQSVLDKYDIGYVVTERNGLLDVALAEAEGWEPVYADDVGVIYVRAEASP
jgi:hypothetical protein